MNTLLTLLVLAVLNIIHIEAFRVGTVSTRIHSSLKMAGGRSPEETIKKATKRQMFKDVRAKLNKAAEIPGFFEVGEGTPEVSLFCKSNKDGTQIGDCPFAQFIQMVMLKKGIRYNLYPTLPDTKPEWLLSKHEGKMPALMHKDETIVDSLAIAEYLEKTFPHTSLTRQGAYSYQEVIEKTSGFFPALSAYIKNKDEGKDADLLTAVEAQLDLLDELIRSSPGQFTCGMEMTLADLYLIPQLFHAIVTMDHFKGVDWYVMGEGDPIRPALENFVARMMATEEFNNKRAYYNVDQVVYGWKVARGD